VFLEVALIDDVHMGMPDLTELEAALSQRAATRLGREPWVVPPQVEIQVSRERLSHVVDLHNVDHVNPD
jgi:hypothetical protein